MLAIQIVKNPARFDVIVTENMFAEILPDEAFMITVSIGIQTGCYLLRPVCAYPRFRAGYCGQGH